MKIRKIPFLVLFLLAAVLVLPASGLSQDKVGFIDPYRIVAESEMGKIARRDIARIREQKEKALRRSLDEINAMKAKGVTQGNATDPNPAYETLKRRYDEHNQLVAKVNEELDEENDMLVALIIARADKILTRLAKKKGYTLIIKDPAVIGYLAPGVDLTDTVIQELNSQK